MKRLALAACAIAAMCAAQVAQAQTPAAKMPDGVFYTKQEPNQYLAGDLVLNAKVVGASGKIVGDIEDLILNEYNQVVGVVMGVGGFLGVGEKRVAVRYSALKFDNQNGKTVVSLPNVTREILKAMPAYVRTRPPKSFMEKVTERAKELAAKTEATTKDAYEKAKKEVGPAMEEAKKKAAEAYEKAKEAYEKAKETYEKQTEKTEPKTNN